MGKKDIISIEYFEDAKRFADLINGYVYEGEEVVLPENIRKENRSWTKKTESSDGKEKEFQILYRDLVREIHTELQITLVCLEEQSKVHYAMPVRVMSADGAMYDRQWRDIEKMHRDKKDVKDAEYLSGFGKNDRLIPVLTIVIYFGQKEWDGPRSLKEMMDLNEFDEAVRALIVDYPIHILDVHRLTELERFHTDIRYVFGFLQKEKDKHALKMYIKENEEVFSHLQEDAYDMLSIFSHSGKLKEMKSKYETEGVVDVCKAIRDMIEDGKAEGKAEGEQDMMILANRVFQLYLQKMDAIKIAAECNTAVETVQRLLKGIPVI